MTSNGKLLEVRNLVTEFKTDSGYQRVVNGISFDIMPGQTVGLVGESGSGKSITSLSIMGLIKPPGRISEHSSIRFQGEELVGKPKKQMRTLRGKSLSMIFQEPMTSLNPVLTIGEQIAETVRIHEGLSRKDAMARAVGMLAKVGIPSPETRANEYPHQMSGGMRQRAMIAIALACNPRLLIADEPTTALDVTIQAQILELMKQLNRELGMGMLLVTHDLGVVAEMCEQVIVMYAGQIVESAPVRQLFADPRHPYTEALLKSIPKIGKQREKLYSIPGNVPSPKNMPTGCRFHTRCAYAFADCSKRSPALTALGDGRLVRCLKVEAAEKPGEAGSGTEGDSL